MTERFLLRGNAAPLPDGVSNGILLPPQNPHFVAGTFSCHCLFDNEALYFLLKRTECPSLSKTLFFSVCYATIFIFYLNIFFFVNVLLDRVKGDKTAGKGMLAYLDIPLSSVYLSK